MCSLFENAYSKTSPNGKTKASILGMSVIMVNVLVVYSAVSSSPFLEARRKAVS